MNAPIAGVPRAHVAGRTLLRALDLASALKGQLEELSVVEPGQELEHVTSTVEQLERQLIALARRGAEQGAAR